MSVFDDMAAVEFYGFSPEDETALRAAIATPCDQGNHSPIPHKSLAHYYAEEAMESATRFRVDRAGMDALNFAFKDGSLSKWAFARGLVLPSPKFVLLSPFTDGPADNISGLLVRKMDGGLCNVMLFGFIGGHIIFGGTFYFNPLVLGRFTLPSVDPLGDDAGLDKDCRGALSVLIKFCTALAIPKMTVIDAVRPDGRLQKARQKRHAAPLLSYNVVTYPLLREGLRTKAKINQPDHSRRAFHSVISHLRYIKDLESPIGKRPVLVAEHWRGDPTIGIRLTERVVK